MISLTAADLRGLAQLDRGVADHVVRRGAALRTNGRELLADWNSFGSVDLTSGRKAELERLATELAKNGSVVIPRAVVEGLHAAPAAMALGFGEAFMIIASAASLFALGFSAGATAGNFVRDMVDDANAVTVRDDGGGNVGVEVEK